MKSQNYSWLFGLVLLLCLIKFLYGLDQAFPIDPADEVYYLRQGIVGPIDMTWGPMYAYFYRIYTLITQDPQVIYYANFALQIALVPLVHFALVRRLGVSPVLSFWSAILVLLSFLAVTALPKVGNFNTSIFYLLLLSATFIRNIKAAAYFLAMVFLITIYIRQDNLILSLGFLVWWLASTYRADWSIGRKLKISALGSAGYIFFGWFLLSKVGTPFTEARAWNAFAIHFGRNVARREGSARLYTETVQAHFGTADTVFQAFLNNPSEFLTHALFNIPLFIKNVFFYAFNFIFIDRWQVALTLVFFALVVFWEYRKNVPETSQHDLREDLKSQWQLSWIFGGLVLARAAITSFLYAPLPRYQLELICALIVLATVGLSRRVDLRIKNYKAHLILAASFLILLPTLGRDTSGNYLRGDLVRRIVKFVNDNAPTGDRSKYFALNAYMFLLGDISSSKILFDDFRSRCTSYVNNDRQNLIAEMKPDVLILDYMARRHIRFMGCDPVLKDFEENSSRFGYRRVLELNKLNSIYFRAAQ